VGKQEEAGRKQEESRKKATGKQDENRQKAGLTEG
jgi:hypothetical protein